ncbi:MAG: ABC transporter substrate-binding protein [Candidatus Acidiferrales bacterium]
MKLRLSLFLAAISVGLLVIPAKSARRPRYGGTLRVEIGAAIASLDPAIAPATPEEAAAKSQIDGLIYDHRDPDGAFSGDPGSGPFAVTTFEPGKRATLAANNNFREGRPFVDSIEILMGVSAHDRLLDLQLNKSDLAEIPPQDARSASERGVRVSISQPDELLALVFHNPDSPANRNPRLREAVAQSIDRAAIVNFILQKTGEPAGGLLPQWSSGTAFLFPTATDPARAKELSSQIAPATKLVLGYDSADPLERSVAERIVVNAKEAGISLIAQALPNPAAANARAGTSVPQRHADAQLVRWRMPSAKPAIALQAALLQLSSGGEQADSSAGAAPLTDQASPQDIFNQQRAILAKFTIVPLVWLPQVYGLSARVRDWTVPGPGEEWRLADVWLDSGAGASAGSDKQP